MPQLNKIFTSGKMNKDADERLLPPGEYRHAENVTVINSENAQNVGAVKNVLSNKILTSFPFTGTVHNITPKPLVYEAKNRIYWFCKDDLGCYFLEYNVDTQILTSVLTDTRPIGTRVLNLDENFLITGIDILKTEDEDKELILWTDNNMQPCCVNIKRAKSWLPNSFEEEDIFLIKKPPLYAPVLKPIYTLEKNIDLENKFLSFAYRYKYLDGEYSAISSFTNYSFSPKKFDIDFFTLVNNGMINQFNAVKIEFNTGDKRVIEIQLILKQSNSNTLYIIETFNKKKEEIADNETKSYIFSNQKIYKSLPENELYRAFDNVPLKAKAQTLINNYIAYGNYLEFFDIKNIYGNEFVLDYDVSLFSESIDDSLSLLTLFPNPNQLTFQNQIGVEYKKDYVLYFLISINLDNINIYKNGFSYILLNDYATIQDIVAEPEFISFVEVINNHFITNYNSENQYDIDPDYALLTEPSIQFSIILGVPTFTVTPIVYQDTANANAIVTKTLSFTDESEVSILSITNVTSCKTNRSYLVAIIYLDKYNRSTTALTSKNNSIFISQQFSTQKNRLKIVLNSLPPIDAVRYKFVIKTDILQYQTIYINEFYNEDNYVWAKLQSDNKDKVIVGDTLILKKYGDIASSEPIRTKVLEIKTFEKDFLTDNEDQNGNPIKETSGIYMKIRPNGFSMDLDDYRISQNKIGDIGSSGRPKCYLDLFTITDFTTITSELAIGQGSSIYLMINSSFRFDSGWKDIRYEKTVFAQRDYNTIEEWFNETLLNGNYIKGVDLRNDNPYNYAPNLSLVRGKITSGPGGQQIFTPNVNGKLYLKVVGLETGGSNGRKAYCRAEIVVRNSSGFYAFETETKQAISDIFYESEETFDIVNGEHHGSEQYPILQNQNKTTIEPAIIDLSFFNCYTQGNGIESYRVRDELNVNWLNIDLRPTATSIEPYRQVRRFADITHSSQPYNESSNVNGLNNFNLATSNFKELDKQYGSIQLIHNRIGDVLVIQEEKAGKLLFGKDAIYTAEGEPVVTKISEVLGQYTPYQGNNGIALNPESFAKDNYRYYWFNSYFGVPIRLSIDGTTEINYGMQTYFRNLSINFRNAVKIGAYDAFNKLYTLNIGEEPEIIDYLNYGNSFHKLITEQYSYILRLNNQIGEIQLHYVVTGNVDINTQFDGIIERHPNLTGTGFITFNRNSLDDNKVIVNIIPNMNSQIQITNGYPIPIPLDIVLVVLGDENDNGKNIQNRFRTNLNNFLQYEDTFTEEPVAKFKTLNGFEGLGLFPINGDTITIQSVKLQSHTGSFLIGLDKIKYLISNLLYTESNINDLISDSINLSLTEITQGENQNTFTGSFEFNRTTLDQKLYLIWDYNNIVPI